VKYFPGRYTSQTQKPMKNTNKNALFRLFCGIGDFYQLCHQNNGLDDFHAFGDAIVQCQNPIPTFSFFGGIPFSRVGESAMGYSMPPLRFVCLHPQQFPWFCFCLSGTNPRNGNGKLGRTT
jgi:hypothetical protein